MRTLLETTRRGLTVVELMLALSIMVIIGAAIVATLGAVSIGVDTRRDSRSHLLHAHVAQVRLSAYLAPSRCVLDTDGQDMVLWFNDTRRSGTVHASEIRWLKFDDSSETLSVYRVRFPSHWTDTRKAIEDVEYKPDADWEAVLANFDAQGWLVDVPLVDGLSAVSVMMDRENPMDARHVTCRLATSDGARTLVSGTLRVHRQPQ